MGQRWWVEGLVRVLGSSCLEKDERHLECGIQSCTARHVFLLRGAGLVRIWSTALSQRLRCLQINATRAAMALALARPTFCTPDRPRLRRHRSRILIWIDRTRQPPLPRLGITGCHRGKGLHVSHLGTSGNYFAWTSSRRKVNLGSEG